MAYVDLKEMSFEAFHHIGKKEFKEAEKKLSYLLNINPNEPVLYYYLGYMFAEKKQWAFAVLAFEKALEFEPNFDECLCNMSGAYRQLNRIDLAIPCFKEAVKIASHPNYVDKCNGDAEKAKINLADYLGNLASCYVGCGNPDEAIKWGEQAIAVYPDRPNSMWNTGLAYLEKGDYRRGFHGYSFGPKLSGAKLRNYHAPNGVTPMWDGTLGQTVVVYGEQGIGDEIMFASMLADLAKDVNVIMESHPRLLDMFRRSFPHLTIYGTRKAVEISWLKSHPQIDAQIPLSQLGQFYRREKSDFPGTPYLVVDERLKANVATKYLEPLSARKKIGIAWKGGVGSTNKSVRCIPLDALKPLFELDCEFISLQYHDNARAEVDALNEAYGREVITHYQDVVDDYDLTAALLGSLDIVISVPQSIVHLAGAHGIETIQMCPKHALWQMGPYGEDMPWYKSVRNIWQLEAGNWDTIVANVVMELKHKGY